MMILLTVSQFYVRNRLNEQTTVHFHGIEFVFHATCDSQVLTIIFQAIQYSVV